MREERDGGDGGVSPRENLDVCAPLTVFVMEQGLQLVLRQQLQPL